MTKLQISNQTNMLFILQSFVTESAKASNLPEPMLQHLKLVSEEAFLHILKNSFAPDETSDIIITTETDKLNFTLSFFDKGLPFDSSLTKEYHPAEDINSLDTEGMELFLIKQFADSVNWINHGIEGKEFRLTFELPQKDILTIINEEKKSDTKKSIKADAEDIELRFFKTSDAIKIARSIYRTYGYTYPNQDLYYPEKIISLNHSGQLISVVAYDKKREEVAGHYALERPGLGIIAESGQAVVSPVYRGFHLMNRMRIMLEEKAAELNLEGIVSQPVTTHVFSQKVNESFGSMPCGFSFALVPQKLSFRKISTSLSQRESCMFYFKPMTKRTRVVYLPKQHEHILTTVYSNLGIAFEKGKSPPSPVKRLRSAKIHSNYYSDWGFGVIQVEQPNENSFREIKQAFYKLLYTMKADVIYLLISLEDNDITKLIEQIATEKFFYGGLAPSSINGKDAIRFQYLNGIIDPSKIQIYSNKAQEIFTYILNEKEKIFR